jgi:hypothetical protein
MLNRNHFKKAAYLIFATLFMVAGCSGTKEVVKDNNPPPDTYRYDESFDPLSLEDDDILIEGDTQSPVIDNTETKSDSGEEIKLKEITGFRVQIFATKDIETASLFELEASERFGHLDHKIYLIFEAPLYKIRVGDCKDRMQAEELRDLATQYGYRESFIVKSKIQVQE